MYEEVPSQIPHNEIKMGNYYLKEFKVIKVL